MRVVTMGPPDIQPASIPRVYVEVSSETDCDTTPNLPSPVQPSPAQPSPVQSSPVAESSPGIYGHSLADDHSAPMAIIASSPARVLAARLAAGGVLVNTWERGLVLSPQTLTDTEAVVVVQAVRRELTRLAVARRARL